MRVDNSGDKGLGNQVEQDRDENDRDAKGLQLFRARNEMQNDKYKISDLTERPLGPKKRLN